MIRGVEKEAFLTFYNMTRNEPVGKLLTGDLKKELLEKDPNRIDLDYIVKNFGNSTSHSKDKSKVFDVIPPRYNLRDKVILEKGEYINSEKIETTVGKILFNKLFIEGTRLGTLLKGNFYNEEVTAKKMKALSQIVADGVMSGALQIEPDVIDYLKKFEFWGLGAVAVFAPSYSMKTIKPLKKVEEKKKELLKKADKNMIGDLTGIEDQLLNLAKEELKGDPGMYMFNSGARGSFENDYKNSAISIGAVQNPITNSYDFMESNYIDGLKKEDFPAAANSVVNGEYPKAIETAKGGYMTKQFFAVFQSIVLDELGSDCGSRKGLTITITKDNLPDYIDQYIIDGNQDVLITEKLDSKYMNHPVIIRSTMYCLSEKPCSKCMGLRYYKLGMENAGLGAFRLAGQLQNASLKLRHSQKINVDHVDPEKYLI